MALGLDGMMVVSRCFKPEQWINVPPVFIVGCARSGTTLMRLILTAHSEISVSSEGAYIYDFWKDLALYGDLSVSSNLHRLYDIILPVLQTERFLLPPAFADLRAWVKIFGGSLKSLLTFFGTWEATVTGKMGLKWWGDNAPYHGKRIIAFSSIFPLCKFIVMIRDPRDVCASIRTSFAQDLVTSISLWERSLLDGLLALRYHGPKRVMHLQYEDLVNSPRKYLTLVCDFLSVEYSEQMLHYYDTLAAASISALVHHRNVIKPISNCSVGRYRSVLSAEDINVIEQRLYTPMTYLNYLSLAEYGAACNAPLAST